MGCECSKLSFDTENEIKKENYDESTHFGSNQYDQSYQYNTNNPTNYKSHKLKNNNTQNENSQNKIPDNDNKHEMEELNQDQNNYGIEKIEEENENENNVKEYKNGNNLREYENKNENNLKEENSFNNNNSNISNNDNIQDHSEYLVKKINISNTPKREEKIKYINNNILPKDDFSKYLFEQINKIRKDPKSFIPIIERSKSNVITKNDKLIYKSKVKVALNEGIPVFDETIQFLEKTDPMNELIFNPDMCVEIPENEDDIKNKNYLKTKIEELNEKGIYIKTYWKDYIKEPETCFILMIVDDTGKKKGNKRNDLLDPNMKNIGISSVKIEKSFSCYITLNDK